MYQRSFHLRVIVGISLLLLAPVLAQETGPASTTEITTEDCQDAFSLAGATLSCTAQTIEAQKESGSTFLNTCYVEANCNEAPGGQHNVYSWFRGGPDTVELLVNCTGTMKVWQGTRKSTCG